MKSLYSVSKKNLFARQITNIKSLEINHGFDTVCIQAKIFAFSISIADTLSIRIAVFFLKIISTNFKVYDMNIFSISDNNS